MSTSTFTSLLSDQLRADAARPLVTFYDDATGERAELSVVTFTNWVNKTAGLMQDELDVERGDLVLVDLPTHWLGAVWLGACWTGGQCATADPELAEQAALVVSGPGGVAAHAAGVDARAVVALSLRPMGARFAEPLPTGVVDYGALVLAQPDSFAAYDLPTGEDAAWRDAAGSSTQSELLLRASTSPLVEAGGRLLSDRNPCSQSGLATFLAPLAKGGSTVWVANPDPARWASRYDSERATAELRAAASG